MTNDKSQMTNNSFLPNGHSAIDRDVLSGDESGFVAGKIHTRRRDVFGDAPAFCGDEIEVAVLGFLRIVFMTFDRNPTRGDQVHGDAEEGPCYWSADQ